MIGAGATFPYPLYSKMFDVYSKEHSVKVNYQAIGSGGGIRQLVNRTVDFGGSDAIMSDEDSRRRAPRYPYPDLRRRRGTSLISCPATRK